MLCAKADSERARVKFPACMRNPHATTVEKTPPLGVNRKLVWAVGLLAGLLASDSAGHVLGPLWNPPRKPRSPALPPFSPLALAPPTPIPARTGEQRWPRPHNRPWHPRLGCVPAYRAAS